jgi:hypothetical protein
MRTPCANGAQVMRTPPLPGAYRRTPIGAHIGDTADIARLHDASRIISRDADP